MAELDEAIEAAALAMYGTPRLAERNRDMAERAVRAAAEVIVAATRRQDRDLLISVLFHHHKKTRTDSDGINGRCVCGWGRPGDAFPLHIADELAAAIARGRGETDTKEQK